MKNHYRLRFLLPPIAEEALVGMLWNIGTSGIELREAAGDRIELDAFFSCQPDLPQSALEAGSPYWLHSGGRLTSVAEIPDLDWLLHYREVAVPLDVGRRLRVDPREPEPAGANRASTAEPTNRRSPDGRFRLAIPARRAFGTGSHESTRLAVSLLEDQRLERLTVLDVGCGSGILALAARLFGAGRVVGVEIDPVATCLAGENQRLNGISFALVTGRIDCLRSDSSFDLAMVNVLPQSIRGDLGQLATLVKVGGRAIFSGLLAAQRRATSRHLRAHGFEPLEWRAEGSWTAVLALRVSSSGGEG